MIARLVTMLAVLALTVIATTAATHAVRLGGPDHTVHLGEAMMHGHEHGEAACEAGGPCPSIDARICKSVCAGVTLFAALSKDESGQHLVSCLHLPPATAILASLAPELNDRPPQLRLL